MQRIYTSRRVLFLAGIKLSDYSTPEDMADQKFCERVDPVPPPTVFDSLPTEFTTLDKWPRQTNLQCWSTGCTFDSMPYGLPYHMEIDGKGNMRFLLRRGVFVTIGHAADYNAIHSPADIREKIATLLPVMFEKMHGIKLQYPQIKRPPPITDLKSYGGRMDPVEYWEYAKGLNMPANAAKPGRRETPTGSSKVARTSG